MWQTLPHFRTARHPDWKRTEPSGRRLQPKNCQPAKPAKRAEIQPTKPTSTTLDHVHLSGAQVRLSTRNLPLHQHPQFQPNPCRTQRLHQPRSDSWTPSVSFVSRTTCLLRTPYFMNDIPARLSLFLVPRPGIQNFPFWSLIFLSVSRGEPVAFLLKPHRRSVFWFCARESVFHQTGCCAAHAGKKRKTPRPSHFGSFFVFDPASHLNPNIIVSTCGV